MKTSQWFVGSKDIESVCKACEAMKCNPVECDDKGRDLVVAFLKSKGRWDDESCAIKPLPKIRLDLGGMVKVNEPSVSWQANGVKFSAMHVRERPCQQDCCSRLPQDRRVLPPVSPVREDGQGLPEGPPETRQEVRGEGGKSQGRKTRCSSSRQQGAGSRQAAERQFCHRRSCQSVNELTQGENT